MIPEKEQRRGSVAIQIRMSGPGADAALSSLYAWLLALAYATWRGTRPSRPHVTIEYGGITVTLDGSEPEAVEAIVHVLDRA
jgi:hypothetical protein